MKTQIEVDSIIRCKNGCFDKYKSGYFYQKSKDKWHCWICGKFFANSKKMGDIEERYGDKVN